MLDGHPQAQRLEAIATLAGGIAHDFNNLLTAIMGFTELTLACLEADQVNLPEFKSNLQEVLQAGQRARDLVDQILAVSRKGEQPTTPVEVALILKEALKLLRASLPATFDIRCHLNVSQGFVLADPSRIHQVGMNLCTNAYHAMRQQGGVLVVSLEEVEVDDNPIFHHPQLQPGPYLKLTVQDNGHGMPPWVLERIFDPYFTTKNPGEGTGLGLAVVHGIVSAMGGAILVDSALDQGTTFQVFFPRLSNITARAAAPPAPILMGNERVLLVDDEPQVAAILKRILEFLGYRVTALNHSLETLKLFRTCPRDFDLVITDLTMPHLTGNVLAGELLKIRPDLPIILMTGFNETISAEKAKELGLRDYLMKPVSAHTLAQAVRKALNHQS